MLLIDDFDWKLHPSAAVQWQNCPRSAQAQLISKRVPNGSDGGEAAQNGTRKHKIAAEFIRRAVAGEEPLNIVSSYTELSEEEIDVMLRAWDEYICGADKIWIENFVSAPVRLRGYGEIAVSGTPDLVILSEDKSSLVIFDWKFGQILVDAYHNKQLEFYYYAFMMLHRDFREKLRTVQLVIAQPSKKDKPIEAFFLEDFTVRAPVVAWDWTGSNQMVEANGGDWCLFCPIRNVCQKGIAAYKGVRGGIKVATADDFM